MAPKCTGGFRDQDFKWTASTNNEEPLFLKVLNHYQTHSSYIWLSVSLHLPKEQVTISHGFKVSKLVLLHHATGDDTLEECSWQEAHELLNKSVELLEDPGEYLKKTDSDDPRIGQK